MQDREEEGSGHMAKEVQTIYFPKSEMGTMLIPVQNGCPHNKCTFCSMYNGCEYKELSIREAEQVLVNAQPYTERAFLTGADPMAIGYDKMMRLLEMIRSYMPYCACVSCYAAVRTIAKYTEEQIRNLHLAGLRMLYVGFESGSDEVLRAVNKGHTVEEAVLQGQKMNAAHLTFNTIVMYGIAGQGKGVENAILTAEMVNQFKSNRIVTMNLTIFAFSKLAAMVRDGKFTPANKSERLLELQTFLECLSPNCGEQVDTAHATNLFKKTAKMPEELGDMIQELKEYRERCDKSVLKEEPRII